MLYHYVYLFCVFHLNANGNSGGTFLGNIFLSFQHFDAIVIVLQSRGSKLSLDSMVC